MEKTFLYHALASGVSGNITLPFHELIEVHAASALPFTGGHSASRAESFRFKDIISFSSASTITTGSETSDAYNTLATATVEGLNILNLVKADRVVARLASKYSKDSRQHSATIAGSYFENLRIAGNLVQIVIPPERLKSPPRSEKLSFGTLAATIDVEGSCGLELCEDGGIHVPEFGKLYFAESVVTACYQSLTMFRVVLGCAVKGAVVASHVSTDGEPFPP
ncbi:MAG: choice-of-anchor P family protein [Terriglobia bacterium]